MRKIHFGIVGSGFMARTQAEAVQRLADHASLVAVWGGSRAPALAQRYGVACELTLEALVRRADIDAVIITTPHYLHAMEAIMAIESGKHVLIEKPMATSLEDCDRINDAAIRHGKVVGIGYCDQLQAFIDGIHGLPLRCGSGKDGRAGVADCLAMLTSSHERRWARPEAGNQAH